MLWLTIVILSIFVIEETIYYFWNRYVFGPNLKRREKWRNRFSILVTLLRRKHKTTDITETNNENSSH